jgi:hypothetical protein
MKLNKREIRIFKYNNINVLVLAFFICSLTVLKCQVLDYNFEIKNDSLNQDKILNFNKILSNKEICAKEVAYRKLLYERLSSKLKESKTIISSCSQQNNLKNEVEKISQDQNEISKAISDLLKLKSTNKLKEIRTIESISQKITKYLDSMKNGLLTFHGEDENIRIKNSFSDLSNKIYSQLIILDIQFNQKFVGYFQYFLNNVRVELQGINNEKTSKIKSKNKNNIFSAIISFNSEIEKLFHNLLIYQKKTLPVLERSAEIFKENINFKNKEILSSSNINNSYCDYKLENNLVLLEKKLNKRREAWENSKAICEDFEKEKGFISYNKADIKVKIKNK